LFGQFADEIIDDVGQAGESILINLRVVARVEEGRTRDTTGTV
jgi:hypothetical protein